MKSLIEGIERYEQAKRQKYASQFKALENGQAPKAVFITCADSRIVPNLVASAGPGELFMVRNVANLVPPFQGGANSDDSVSSAIWYALEVLGTREVVVCGHSGCGGINALRNGAPTPVLERWLSNGKGALELFSRVDPIDASLSENDQLSQLSTRVQLGNLMTYEFVRERVQRGEVHLHAWWFDIASGRMFAYSSAAGRYVPAVEALDENRPLSARRMNVMHARAQ